MDARPIIFLHCSHYCDILAGHMRRVTSKLSQRGFTLVELLVVIAIISVLISILLPALSKATESARSVQCASNLRNIGTAVQAYVQENRGYYPMMQLSRDQRPTRWPDGLCMGRPEGHGQRPNGGLFDLGCPKPVAQ
jgi:prepilin-type N-terminal cleavage/methylation domain-containing protein